MEATDFLPHGTFLLAHTVLVNQKFVVMVTNQLHIIVLHPVQEKLRKVAEIRSSDLPPDTQS
jgi:hypothetical protein